MVVGSTNIYTKCLILSIPSHFNPIDNGSQNFIQTALWPAANATADHFFLQCSLPLLQSFSYHAHTDQICFSEYSTFEQVKRYRLATDILAK